jgi:hypothetical protein
MSLTGSLGLADLQRVTAQIVAVSSHAAASRRL